MGIDVSLGAAFIAGVLSFFSPCVLPLLPVYVSQMSSSVSRPNSNSGLNWNISLQAIIFIFGFSAVFIALGMVTSFIGRFLMAHRDYLLKAGGLFVLLMGLNLMGLLRFTLFARQWKPMKGPQYQSIFRSFFMGVAFALGWMPCTGPVLASILALAATSRSVNSGSVLLAGYSLGMAIPFLVLALTFDRLPRLQDILRKYSRFSLQVSGFLLVILGVLMFFNKLQVLAAYLTF